MKTDLLKFLATPLLIASTLCAQSSPPPAAQVTFYTSRSAWKTGLPGDKHGYFYGVIFDGDTRLAYFNKVVYGIVADPGQRFLTIQLPAGSHTFSASYSSKHPADNSQLTIDLAPGGRYFIRTESAFRGFPGVYESERGVLTPVTCQVAHKEAPKAVPVEAKKVGPAFQKNLLPDTHIPDCD
jgi:hypothetical protein